MFVLGNCNVVLAEDFFKSLDTRLKAKALALEEGVLAFLIFVQRLDFLDRQFLVDFGLVTHALSSRAEAKSRQCLFKVIFRRAACDDQRRLRVTAERLLQDAREFTVAVWWEHVFVVC